MSSAVVILAAGQGERMKSDRAKVLHAVGGAPLIAHVVAAAQAIAPERLVVVTGHQAETVEAVVRTIAPEAHLARQDEALGTAHAVAQARAALDGSEGDVIVLYGDTPFVRPETLAAMQAARRGGAAVVVLGFQAADPTGYGRLIATGDMLEAIVEHRDADAETRAITLCNSGVICAGAGTLFGLIDRVGNANARGEYYLTDIVGLARAGGHACTFVTCPEAETLGINSRADLARAEAAFQSARRGEMLAGGVTLTAPETVFFAHDTHVGADTVIGPHVVFGPGVTVENGAEIRAFCHLEGCHVAEGAQIGPFARLRPGAEIGEGARIGNFVEIKEALVDRGAKVNHLAYIGDATVGEAANIGAGAITCNYDGVSKHRTEIGARAFIGSNSALVAPVRVGANAFVAAGSTITEDVAPGALAVGRARQATRPGLAIRLMDRLRALKAARSREDA